MLKTSPSIFPNYGTAVELSSTTTNTSSNQNPADLIINSIQAKNDLGIEVPAIYSSHSRSIALVEIFSELCHDPEQSLAKLDDTFKNIGSEMTFAIKVLQYDFIPTPTELFTLRRLALVYPEMNQVEQYGNYLTIHLSGAISLARQKQIISIANSTFDKHSIIIKNQHSYSLTSKCPKEKWPACFSKIWSQSERFINIANIAIKEIDNTTIGIAAHIEDSKIKDKTLIGKAKFLQNLFEGKKCISNVRRSTNQRHTIRQAVSAAPQSASCVRVFSDENQVHIGYLLSNTDTSSNLKGTSNTVRQVSNNFRTHFMSDVDSFSQLAFAVIPVQWGLTRATRGITGNAHLLLTSPPPVISPEECTELSQSLGVSTLLVNSEAYTNIETSAQLYSSIASLLSSGVDLLKIEQSKVTNELLITTNYPIDKKELRELENKIGLRLENKLILAKQAAPNFVAHEASTLKKAGPIYSGASKDFDKVKLTGLGGCQEIGGSCLILELPELTILLDYGARFDYKSEPALTNEQLETLDYIVITHAHTDHIGWLSNLVARILEINPNHKIKVIASEATFLLGKYVHSCIRDRGSYIKNSTSAESYLQCLEHACIAKQNIRYQLAPNTHLTFYDSGHILGSCSVKIESHKSSITYTGDMRYGQSRLHNPANVTKSDVVIIESTYGARPSQDRLETEEELLHAVSETLEKGGTVLAPALVIGRSQEILTILHSHAEYFAANPQFKIFVDGSINEMVKLYNYFLQKSPALFNTNNLELLKWLAKPNTLFKPIVSSGRKSLACDPSPKIIVTSAGMLAGLAGDYFEALKHSESNLLLLSCYQAQGTKGRRLLDYLERNSFANEFEGLKMRVKSFNLSGHSSQDETLNYLSQTASSLILLNHGARGELFALKSAINDAGMNSRAAVLHPNLPYILSEKKISPDIC